MKNRSKIVVLLLIWIQASFAIDPDTAFNRQFRQEIGGWIAADATYSIYLPDGRTLWLFGDTFIGVVNEDNSIVPGSRFIRNSAVIQDGNDLQTLFRGTRSDPSDFIPTDHLDSLWYWPEHGIVENDTLRIFVAKFRKNPDGPSGFQFEHAGNDIANFTYPGLEHISNVAIYASASNDVLDGDRILEDTSHIYIYGRRNDDPSVNIPYPHVARALKGEVMEQGWEFYTGSGWSSDPDATQRINSFQVSQQYSVTRFMGKYILLTQDIWTSPKIFTFTSETPVGPWKNKKLVYTTPESSGTTWTYNAYAHPQFNSAGELLVSYNVNGDFASIFNNVEIYRPRFIRIPYMNMDFAFWSSYVEQPGKGADPEIYVYPVPAREHVTISIPSLHQSALTLDILDANGKLVKKERMELSTGENEFRLGLQGLSPGYYYCRIYMDEGLKTVRLLKY